MNFLKKNHSLSAIGVKFKKSNRNIVRKTLFNTTILTLLVLIIFSCSKDDTTAIVDQPATLSSISPLSGPKTTIVTITGSNFDTNAQNTKVFFDDIEATVQTITETTIIAVVPPRAFIGEVSVKTKGQTLTGLQFEYIITDIQVSTLTGLTDGTGTAVTSGRIFDIAIDSQGNLYIPFRSEIRKITPNGVVSTFVGSNTSGFADGTGADAQFSFAFQNICIDAQDNLYVGDRHNAKIRKITPSRVVSTLAGSTTGFADGTGDNAQFDDPRKLTVDAQGNVYVTERDPRIRKITPNGVVSTLAGSSTGGFADGIGANAQFFVPTGLSVDVQNNVYVADRFNNRIRKITPNGVVSTVAGSTQGFADGTGATAQFNTPFGVAIDSQGNLYVADTGNNRIRKITPNGVVSTVAGSTQGFADGTGAIAKFNTPSEVTIDSQGNLYVADVNNSKIRKITQE